MSDSSIQNTRTNLLLGIAVLAMAALVALVWIPVDVESGVFEKVRSRLEIGDAFAPTLAAGLLGLGGLLLVMEAMNTRSALRMGVHSFQYVIGLLIVFAMFSFLLMWTGPALVALFGAKESEYRLLRDTVPWKYAGFLLGGTFLVTTLISVVEHRLTWQSALIGVAASLAMIVLYDLPFDDLLLPPNGDF